MVEVEREEQRMSDCKLQELNSTTLLKSQIHLLRVISVAVGFGILVRFCSCTTVGFCGSDLALHRSCGPFEESPSQSPYRRFF